AALATVKAAMPPARSRAVEANLDIVLSLVSSLAGPGRTCSRMNPDGTMYHNHRPEGGGQPLKAVVTTRRCGVASRYSGCLCGRRLRFIASARLLRHRKPPHLHRTCTRHYIDEYWRTSATAAPRSYQFRSNCLFPTYWGCQAAHRS